MEFNTLHMRTKQHSYFLKKASTKGHRGREVIFLKSSSQVRAGLGFGPTAPECSSVLSAKTASLPGSFGHGLQAGTPGAEENAQARCRGEACTHGPLLIMHVESAWNLPLHLEILCLNTNASQLHRRKLTINGTEQPITGLPLNHIQRQKWINFEFYLKVNQLAVYFSRKSYPTRH